MMMDASFNFNVTFVKTMKKYKVLYDNTSEDYSNRQAVEKAWAEVGKEMRATASACKDKWKNIRSAYTRYLRGVKFGGPSAPKKRKYYLAHYLDFLEPFTNPGCPVNIMATLETNNEESEQYLEAFSIKHEDFEVINEDDYQTTPHIISVTSQVKPTQINDRDPLETVAVDSSTEINANKNDDHSDLQFETNEVFVMENKIDTKISRTPTVKSSKNNSETLETMAVEYVDYKETDGANNNESDDHSDLQFLKSLLPDLHKMSSRQKHQFKIKTMQTIGDILYNN